MTLEAILQRMIKLDGPIRLDRVMAMVSTYYYENHHIFGADGDFITAPEISPFFSYTISNWLHSIWQENGHPQLQIVEMGPGNGTLMHDLLIGNKRYPDLQKAVESIVMIERSQALIARQQQKLAGQSVVWRDGINDVNKCFTIIIANEFFDALPIRQWIKEKEGWAEIYLMFEQGKGFQFVKGRGDLDLAAAVGDVAEVCPQAKIYAQEISQALKVAGGAALVIDYGYDKPSTQSTLQAVKNHKHHNLLDGLGTADWTAHVNFNQLLQVLPHAKIFPQGDFLKKFGIEEMMQESPHSLARLTDKQQMGELFKVLELVVLP